MAGLLPNLRTPACGGLLTRWVALCSFSKRGVALRAVVSARRAPYCSSTEAGKAGSMMELMSVDRQFEEFRLQLEESGAVRERLRAIVSELDSATRLMQAQLLLIHHSRPSPEILSKIKAHTEGLRSIYGQLAEVLKSVPAQYYRYHDHWRNQTYTVVFLLAFIHWLETGGLLSHGDAAALLGLKDGEFGLDLEDYLVGLCNLSNELPRYVVNQVTTGDYDCAKRASVFLSDLYAAFRMLNLRNDLLRKRFDGMKYDLKKVEEVLYDVKIRGLLSDTTPTSAAES
ncbi:hypothetical protein GOP47_0020748 [Adiantum capillus-veneris]|uniref:Translin n=1 Tax=Adiantum capillus-veneris TaxID=13818 RepID=A0A9D4U9S0_ADICA|nr:hypothetical protein GOP47_0020748 [Adiantum capillus-veneris]